MRKLLVIIFVLNRVLNFKKSFDMCDGNSDFETQGHGHAHFTDGNPRASAPSVKARGSRMFSYLASCTVPDYLIWLPFER